jgi:carboxymethylenebutenolidase
MNEDIQLSDNGMDFPAYLARPEGRMKGALILIHEVWGLTDHIKSVAERLAGEGYLALAPDLLSETGITAELIGGLQEELFDPERRARAQPKLRKLMAPLQAPGFGDKTLAKAEACFDFLSRQEGVNGRIGIIGFCFGGTYSFSLAVRQAKLRLAVPFYGHADFSVQELKKITCPILAFYGESDERLMAALPQLQSKMKKAGVNFTPRVYSDCGHAFFNDTNKFTYNKTASTDAWNRALEFISQHLSL